MKSKKQRETDNKELIQLQQIISGNLKRLRGAGGYTQQFLADYLLIDRSTYTYYETGVTLPNIIILCRLAVLYGININDFLNDNDV